MPCRIHWCVFFTDRLLLQACVHFSFTSHNHQSGGPAFNVKHAYVHAWRWICWSRSPPPNQVSWHCDAFYFSACVACCFCLPVSRVTSAPGYTTKLISTGSGKVWAPPTYKIHITMLPSFFPEEIFLLIDFSACLLWWIGPMEINWGIWASELNFRRVSVPLKFPKLMLFLHFCSKTSTAIIAYFSVQVSILFDK